MKIIDKIRLKFVLFILNIARHFSREYTGKAYAVNKYPPDLIISASNSIRDRILNEESESK